MYSEGEKTLSLHFSHQRYSVYVCVYSRIEINEGRYKLYKWSLR